MSSKDSKKRAEMMKDEKVIARLELVVEYDELPDQSEIDRLIEEAQGQGAVSKAILSILKAVKKELI